MAFVHKAFIFGTNNVRFSVKNSHFSHKNFILTSGLSEPGDDVGGELVGLAAGVRAPPLVLDGHLERPPLREDQTNAFSQNSQSLHRQLSRTINIHWNHPLSLSLSLSV